jgi:hypothetical protein
MSFVDAGTCQLSIEYRTTAVAIALISAILAVSLALSLAFQILGIKVAAKIPMMIITISISIRVNHLFFMFKEKKI